jgi:DNA-binding transcriptional ArsR family regulator
MWPEPIDDVLEPDQSRACCAARAADDASCPRVAGTSATVSLRDFMAITKALADEQRVRVLLALRQGELCVCQVVELLGLAPSTISKHISILKQARLVDNRKQGRWIYYRLADVAGRPAVEQALTWVARSLDADPRIVRDSQRIASLFARDPQALCRDEDGCQHTCH